jgi:Carbohydrate family 9 binding domain-like
MRSKSVLPLTLSLLLLPIATTATASAQTAEGPPRSYDVYRTPTPPHIDGKLDDPAWRSAPWTTDFVDIEGSAKPHPPLRTRIKLLWDDDNLYIAAELQEPDVKATLTKHDSIIYQDNDFELFLKPLADATGYFEFEINALNTSWDLYLNKPYDAGGKPDSSWDIPGLKTAVAIQGTLNQSTDKDRGWTVEIAIPWTAYASRLPVTRPQIGPGVDTVWRANFSRVEWPKGVSIDTPAAHGEHKENNWVWTPQGAVNMHIPEKWGYLHFRDRR